MKFYLIKLKQLLFPFIFLTFTICLVIFSNNNLIAAKNGLHLWATSVIPSLFPFFVATELLSYTNFTQILGRLLNKIMKPFFNVRGEGSFALIMGIISGYPVGAKIATKFRADGTCTKEECERLLSFTNNSGPLFIIGTVGISMFGNSSIGLLLFITHILACLTTGFIFRFWKYKYKEDTLASCNKSLSNYTYVNLSNLGKIIGDSINHSISTIMMIGGFVVIFSVIISILKSSKLLLTATLILKPITTFLHIPATFIEPLITGLLEITNGISSICSINIKDLSTSIIFVAFLLGFGGISIFLQVFSITSKSDLSIKPYIYGKILQGLFAAFYTFLIIYNFPFFNFNLN